ncbi:MAG: JAB domain-containing protein [Niabella sp.]
MAVNLSSGGTTVTIADIRLVFVVALKATALSIIISHNHPSSDFTPSAADQYITQKIKSAGELLDIKLLDHIIVTSEGYYSFADEGL